MSHSRLTLFTGRPSWPCFLETRPSMASALWAAFGVSKKAKFQTQVLTTNSVLASLNGFFESGAAAPQGAAMDGRVSKKGAMDGKIDLSRSKHE